MPEGGEREVGDLGGDGFGVGDDGRAELGEQFSDLGRVLGDFFVGEGAIVWEVKALGREEALPKVEFADEYGEGSIHSFVTFEGTHFFYPYSEFGKDRILLVGGVSTELWVAFAPKELAESGRRGGIEEEEQPGGSGDVEGAWGVVEGDAGFEVFAGVIVEYEGSAFFGIVEALKVIDEGSREWNEFTVAVEAFVHDAFEIGFGDKRVFGGGCREEPVFHLVELGVAGGVAVLEIGGVVADEVFGELAKEN